MESSGNSQRSGAVPDKMRTVAEKKYTRRYATLLVLSISLLIINIDDTIVNVAIPTLQRVLGASAAELQWIVTTYVLVFAGFLLTMGSLGDRSGRKRTLQIGLSVFGIASVLAAYSPGSLPLIASRSLMGLGAAMIMPSTLSVIVDVFPREERAKAIGIWTGVASLGLPLGPLLGGWLLQSYWWGSIFLINVPIVLVALVSGLFLVPESRHPAPPMIDFGGMAMSTVALASLLYAIIEIPQLGWENLTIWVAFLSATVFGISFVRHERLTNHPMMDLGLLRNRNLSSGGAAIVITFLVFAGLAFTVVQYLQIVRGFSPFETGILILPLVIAVMTGAGASPRLVSQLGPRRTIAVTLLVMAAGLFLVSTFSTATDYWTIALIFVPIGFGLGSAMVPSTAAIMEAVPKENAGIGSSLNDVARQLGAALGVGLLGSLLASTYSSDVTGAVASLPSNLATIAQNSVGGAARVATFIGGESGRTLMNASLNAFVGAFGLMSVTAAFIAIAGSVVILRFMPSTKTLSPERDISATAITRSRSRKQDSRELQSE